MHARRWTGPVRALSPRLRPASCSAPSHLAAFLLFLLSLAASGTVGAAGNVVQYTYDLAGNITNIQRQTAPGFAITSFTPTSGPVGTAVTIYGTGFSATPASNSVQFNGTAASVSASDSGSIGTTVPAGTTTGRITVTVNGVTATSATDFVVVVPGVPTITGFSPTSGAPGTTVTITGTNFDTAAGATTAKLNGVAGSVTVTDTQTMTFVVPNGAASGVIGVAASGGAATSSGDFIVPPPGMAATDIVSSVRMAAGGAGSNIAIGSSGKSGVVLFDGIPSTYYSAQFNTLEMSPTTAALGYKIINPDNSVLATGTIGGSSRPTILMPKVAMAGTYSVVLSPGTATLNTNMRIESKPVLTVDGPSVASTLDFAFQSARFVFDATANERIGIGFIGVGFTPSTVSNPSMAVSVFQADGTAVSLGAVSCTGPSAGSNAQGNCDAELLAPLTGRYTLVTDSPTTAYANATVQLSSEITGTLAPDAAQAVTIARTGQDARFGFTANGGDSFGIDMSAMSILPQAQLIDVYLYKPDGTSTTHCSMGPPPRSYCEFGTLAAAGGYSVYLDPAFGAYGTASVVLKQGTVLLATDPASAFAPAGTAESARFRVSATAGQNLSVGVSSLAYVGSGSATTLAIYTPAGTQLTTASCTTTTGRCRALLSNLPATGTYSVSIQPPSGVKISGNVNLSSDITGTLSPSVAQPVNAIRAGQLARFTFAGAAGDSTSVKLIGVATTPARQPIALNVYRPEGGLFASVALSGSAAIANLSSLPVTGTYTVVADPYTGAAWQGQLELDPGAAIGVDGAVVSPTNATPGEPLRYAFTATSGQRIEFGLSGLAYAASGTNATSINIYGPTGSTALSLSCSTSGAGACDGVISSAPSAGTYSMVITPPSASAISGGSFALSTALAGTLIVGDPAQTIAITRPGQTARYTFSGAAAQLLHLGWSSAAVSSGATVFVSILKPDGTTLASGSFVNGASGGFDIPSLPATGTYTVVLDPSLAATMSAAISLVTR